MRVYSDEFIKIYDPSEGEDSPWYVNDHTIIKGEDPFNFGGEPVGRIPSHASEVIKVDGKYYITHCGWGQGGVYLAPLHFEIQTDSNNGGLENDHTYLSERK